MAQGRQGRVAPALGNAKLPERLRDVSGPRKAGPASLSAKSPSSVRAGAPGCPKDMTDIDMKGRAEDICQYARLLEVSWAEAANPGVRAAPPAKDAAVGWMTETSPTTSRCGNTNMTSPRAPGTREGGTPRGSGERTGATRQGEGARSSGSARAAAGASAGASGTRTWKPEAQPPEEEASAGQAEGMAGGEEGMG
jgi:hypothetical protein